jgi:hypothetical protein
MRTNAIKYHKLCFHSGKPKRGVANLRNSHFRRRILPLKGVEGAKKQIQEETSQTTSIENFRRFLAVIVVVFLQTPSPCLT